MTGNAIAHCVRKKQKEVSEWDGCPGTRLGAKFKDHHNNAKTVVRPNRQINSFALHVRGNCVRKLTSVIKYRNEIEPHERASTVFSLVRTVTDFLRQASPQMR